MLSMIFKLIIVAIAVLDIFFLIKSILNSDKKSIIGYLLVLIVLGVMLFLPSFLRSNNSNSETALTVVKIGTEGAYYPWNYVSASGNPEGFDVDIAKAVANRIHKKAKFIITPWESLVPNLMNNQTDLIVSSLSITDDRKNNVAFSAPYAQVLASFFGLNNNFSQYKNADIATLKKALKGKTIGVQSGTTLPLYLLSEFKDIVTIKYYENQGQLMLEVNSGRIDAGFSEAVAVNDFIQKNPKIGFFGPQLGIKDSQVFGEGIAIAVNKNNPKLLNEVNAALAIMQNDGTIKALSIKYFGIDISYSGK